MDDQIKVIEKVEEKIVAPKKAKIKDYVFAVGRRREAKARVRVYQHVKAGLVWGETEIVKGQMYVNQKPIEKYFSSKVDKVQYLEPLRVINCINKYAVTAKVEGGGNSGQLDALINGMARALSALDVVKYRPILKSKGFLTRDPRVRERRKVGMGGKARRKRQSPKR